MRRFLLWAGVCLLLLSVVTLSTESRIRLDFTQHHLSNHCKCTGTFEQALPALPAPLHAVVAPLAPAPDEHAPELAGFRWQFAERGRTHLLRAPPTSLL
ncbi:MAG TPA: hypothetical protein VHA11_01805 [Bryobacteraceae bacterium]|nr:hypothetical protein [Bryobacteraceae bacterium]